LIRTRISHVQIAVVPGYQLWRDPLGPVNNEPLLPVDLIVSNQLAGCIEHVQQAPLIRSCRIDPDHVDEVANGMVANGIALLHCGLIAHGLNTVAKGRTCEAIHLVRCLVQDKYRFAGHHHPLELMSGVPLEWPERHDAIQGRDLLYAHHQVLVPGQHLAQLRIVRSQCLGLIQELFCPGKPLGCRRIVG